MCCGCKKCSKISGILVLLLGVAFLLQDMGTWAFFNLSWYSALFLVVGVVMLAMNSCKDCQKLKAGK
jgi:hypothetical protein